MFSSVVTGLAGDNSKTACDTWQAQFGQGQQVIENAFRYSGIIRRIVTQEPDDALRKGFTIDGLDSEGQRALNQFNQRRQFVSKFQTNREWARKYGMSAILMDIQDGREWSEPVDFSNIKRLGQLTVLDRWELNISGFAHDLERGEMYAPQSYMMVNDNQRVIHPDRLLVMQGLALTPREQMANMGVGESIINSVWKSIRDYLTTHAYLAEAVTRSTQGVLTMPALEGSMTGCDMAKVEERMEMLSFWMSAIGDIALTKDETYEVIQRGFAGMAEVARTFFEQLSVDVGIPMTILGAQTPGGLNSGNNVGEWQAWTSKLAGVQVRTYNPLVRQYMNVVFRAGNSPAEMPESWDIEWPDLFEQNSTEFSGSVLAIANAGVLLASNGMFTAKEVRGSSILTKAFPHDEATTDEDLEPDEVDEPEDEELSANDGDDDGEE